MDDRLMINDLFVRYTTALDAGDVETIVACFTEDGALESPAVGIYAGRQGIREFAERYRRLDATPFQSCFAYSRRRLGDWLSRLLPEDGAGRLFCLERPTAPVRFTTY